MTIQDKITILTTYLSNNNSLGIEEKKDLWEVIDTATKFFLKGDILKLDPAVLKETYEKWDYILDTKIKLFQN